MPDPQLNKWKATNSRQVKLTDSIISFIANDLLPLSITDSTDFRNFLSMVESCFTMPSMNHISQKLIPQLTASVQDQLRSQMQQAQDLCLTTDLWSSRDMRSFIGITGHFILDYTLQSVMLACQHFKGKHSAENSFRMYEEMMACYNIANKVSGIVTDNATNMLKAHHVPTIGCPGQ
ncbi:UNVERIFIED_CONTAM: hypothetical protein FKN15_061982 [Acipenser sinensis]